MNDLLRLLSAYELAPNDLAVRKELASVLLRHGFAKMAKLLTNRGYDREWIGYAPSSFVPRSIPTVHAVMPGRSGQSGVAACGEHVVVDTVHRQSRCKDCVTRLDLIADDDVWTDSDERYQNIGIRSIRGQRAIEAADIPYELLQSMSFAVLPSEHFDCNCDWEPDFDRAPEEAPRFEAVYRLASRFSPGTGMTPPASLEEYVQACDTAFSGVAVWKEPPGTCLLKGALWRHPPLGPEDAGMRAHRIYCHTCNGAVTPKEPWSVPGDHTNHRMDVALAQHDSKVVLLEVGDGGVGRGVRAVPITDWCCGDSNIGAVYPPSPDTTLEGWARRLGCGCLLVK